jgi:zinc transporter ZupT
VKKMRLFTLKIPTTDPNILFLSGLIAIGLAITHLYSGRLTIPNIPRNRWLSAAGGVSVAYVFVHILPELSQHQRVLEQVGEGVIPYVESHVYILTLVGLSVFYGLERLAVLSRQRQEQVGKVDMTTAGVFWLHIASFALYNALIGYLLVHREESGITSLLIFASAMAVHFIVNDQGLREHHKHVYDNIGRWILAGAIIVGWVLGSATTINEAAVAVLFAFLAGGIVLNVLKEELPEERESKFWAFVLGAGVYTALLLAV